MIEIKNVSVWTGGPSDNLNWNVGDECYPSRDYDMKITFTKKEKPLAVGDVIKYDHYNGSKTATVMAIDGDECWLKFSDGSHATWELDEVYR